MPQLDPSRTEPCVDCGGSSAVPPRECRCCDHAALQYARTLQRELRRAQDGVRGAVTTREALVWYRYARWLETRPGC